MQPWLLAEGGSDVHAEVFHYSDAPMAVGGGRKNVELQAGGNGGLGCAETHVVIDVL